jgi:hypothetical protein
MKAHIGISFVAFGVFVPFAVAFLVYQLPKDSASDGSGGTNPRWFRYHMPSHAVGFVFCLLGFMIGMRAQPGQLFHSGHSRLGVVLLLLSFLQFGGGLYRMVAVEGRVRELVHRFYPFLGYFYLIIGVVTMSTGFGLMSPSACKFAAVRVCIGLCSCCFCVAAVAAKALFGLWTALVIVAILVGVVRPLDLRACMWCVFCYMFDVGLTGVAIPQGWNATVGGPWR